MQVYLDIDCSDLNDEIERLRAILTPERFDQVMFSIFQRAGGRIKQILREEVPKKYHVKRGEVSQTVGRPRLTGGAGGGTGCIIPLRGARRSIGGSFSASGGSHGWNAKKSKRRYKIKARIVKSAVSELPATMKSYGGQPPFRNLGSKLGKLTFTREGPGRLPIRKVEGIAIPQMPMNRSADAVQKDISAFMQARMQHEFERLLGGGR